MALWQYRPDWSVPGAGAANTVMHFEATPIDAPDIPAVVRAFFLALAPKFPNDVTISFPNELFEIDPATGNVLDIETVVAPASVAGTNTANWIGAAGAQIIWETGVVVNSRRLRGKTFLVPLGANNFDNDGTLAGVPGGEIKAAADNLLSGLTAVGATLEVYSRTHHVHHAALSSFVPDRSAILRSRRD